MRRDLDHAAADAAFHDATAELYEARLIPIFAAFFPLVIDGMLDRLADAARDGEVLDVGCGTGTITIRLAGRGVRVEGIDHSAGMLALAAREVADRGLGARVTLRQGDIRALPYAAGTFSAVACHGVLHHLEDHDALLAEIARVLRPGGLVSIAEPCQGAVPTEPLWNATRRVGHAARLLVGRLRRTADPDSVAVDSPADVPAGFEDEHEEAPLDADSLVVALRDAGFDPEVQYWQRFEGLHHRSWRTQLILNRALTAPWRTRRGNLAFIVARRRG